MGKTFRHNDEYSPTDYKTKIRDRQECLDELFNEDGNDFHY